MKPHPAESTRPTDLSRPLLEAHPVNPEGRQLCELRYEIAWMVRNGHFDRYLLKMKASIG